jgi:hypothetical protein
VRCNDDVQLQSEVHCKHHHHQLCIAPAA